MGYKKKVKIRLNKGWECIKIVRKLYIPSNDIKKNAIKRI
jgi:hypothetical protein